MTILQPAMMQPPPRPLGVSLLAILDVIIGVLAFLVGGIDLTVGPSLAVQNGNGSVAGLVAALSAVIILVGALSFVSGYGLWFGKSWAWTLAVVFEVLSIALTAFYIALGEYYYVFSVILGFLILWYLWRPHVKTFFGKGGTAATTEPLAPATVAP